jgi:hypothetical protein
LRVESLTKLELHGNFLLSSRQMFSIFSVVVRVPIATKMSDKQLHNVRYLGVNFSHYLRDLYL